MIDVSTQLALLLSFCEHEFTVHVTSHGTPQERCVLQVFHDNTREDVAELLYQVRVKAAHFDLAETIAVELDALLCGALRHLV